MKLSRRLNMTYKHMEYLHKKYGLVLHGSVFIFSLLLGIGLGMFLLLINVVQMKEKTKEIRNYEKQVMERLVKKIEAASPQ